MEVPDPDALISTKAIGAGGRHRTADGVGDEQAVDQASGLLTRSLEIELTSSAMSWMLSPGRYSLNKLS